MQLSRSSLRKFCAPLLSLWLFSGAAQASFIQLPTHQLQQGESELVVQLANANSEQRENLLVELTALFRAQIGTRRPATVAALGKVLQNDAVPLIRTLAARALELAGDPTASDLLLAALASEHELATRKAILYALVRYPNAQVTAQLLPLLRDKEAEIRATTAFVLAEQADTAAAPSLLTFLQKQLKDVDGFARSQAARALGRIGYQAALPALLIALQKDHAASVRREAAVALGWLTTTPNNAVLSALQQAAQAEDPYLRAAASGSLEQIKTRLSNSD